MSLVKLQTMKGAILGFAFGRVALDGTNPTPVATGLSKILAGFAVANRAAPPGAETSIMGTSSSGGTLNIEAYKATATADTALIDSTGTYTVDWFAIGEI